VRTDPTDNGGLFVGRRPGTAPTKYRSLPERGTPARRRADRLGAHALLALEVLISLLFWGPIPAGSLWLASRVQYWTDNVGLAILVAFVAMIAVLMGGLMVLKRVDRMWILMRRAAGVDQRQGALGRVFAVTACICAAAFAFWFIVINGPGSSSFSGQGG
jgi:amino acid transporter